MAVSMTPLDGGAVVAGAGARLAALQQHVLQRELQGGLGGGQHALEAEAQRLRHARQRVQAADYVVQVRLCVRLCTPATPSLPRTHDINEHSSHTFSAHVRMIQMNTPAIHSVLTYT